MLPNVYQMERFVPSRLASTLDECGDEVKQPVNETIRCIRRTADGMRFFRNILRLFQGYVHRYFVNISQLFMEISWIVF